MGFDGPIDINHEAIHSQMDLRKVKDREACFDKVLVMSKAFINKLREK